MLLCYCFLEFCMFERAILKVVQERLKQFPVAVLTGPRQSGKTTLLRTCFSDYDYINLESPATLEQLRLDPKSWLSRDYSSGVIIDEAQKYPDLFSYVQVISDEKNKKGNFILSGSQNFLLSQHITQSLAGRAAILELLPLSYKEYMTNPTLGQLDVWEWLYHGGYPRPYQDEIPIDVWMDSYIQTYLERDVRDLLAIHNLEIFKRFLKLCAGRHGQILNINQLAIDAGVSHTTAKQWLSILESSYILFQLPPYYNNFSKRLIKSPKLYFYDSGLVSHLLGVQSAEHLSIHSARGAIFEGHVMSEIKKYFVNLGKSQALYYWRDNNGLEVDCLIEVGDELLAIEIKSTATYRTDLLKALFKWGQSIEQKHKLALIYTGESFADNTKASLVSWREIDLLFTN
jgi:predicted AAA+ superfamily ATPase